MELPESPNMTINEFYTKFAGRVVRCKKFNRKSCWDAKDVTKWWESVQIGWNINPLIYIDIESCIIKGIADGNDNDVKYFDEYKQNGYTFITIEGGNRHDSTVSFYNNQPLYRDKKVKVAVICGVSRKEMHEGYVRLAHGKPPNEQEKRTGIYGEVSDKVRNSSQKLSHMMEQCSSINLTRMKDDELVAMIMNFASNGSFGNVNSLSKDKAIDILYETSIYNKTKFNYLVGKLQKAFDSIIDCEDITTKQNKSIIYLLTIIFMEMKGKYKIDDMDLLVKYWYRLYREKFIDDTVIFIRGAYHLPFSNLMTGLLFDQEQLTFLTSIVNQDFIPLLEEMKAISPTNPENYTALHRKGWVNKNKFKDNKVGVVKVRCNTDDKSMFGPTVDVWKTITIAEAFNGTKYELDHIIPKVDGGKTTIENAELTTRDYNRKKSKKHISELVS